MEQESDTGQASEEHARSLVRSPSVSPPPLFHPYSKSDNPSPQTLIFCILYDRSNKGHLQNKTE